MALGKNLGGYVLKKTLRMGIPLYMMNEKDKTVKILDAALDVAASSPWEFASLLEVSGRSGVELEEIKRLFPEKRDIMETLVRRMDAEVLEAAPIDAALPVRERLFDLLMDRFDAMNAHRRAHISFIRAFGWNQCEKIADIRLYAGSLGLYVRAAGLGRAIAARIVLSALYAPVLWVWMHDESADLGKTMAALDRCLGRFEAVGNWLSGATASKRSRNGSG